VGKLYVRHEGGVGVRSGDGGEASEYISNGWDLDLDARRVYLN